jgi:hypothetical protein
MFSPLSHVWLPNFIHIVQMLTMEVDFTRFGGSMLKLAPEFGYYMETTELMLIDIVLGLLKRKGTATMAEFNMMCRRYAGFRPYDEPAPEEPEVTPGMYDLQFELESC